MFFFSPPPKEWQEEIFIKKPNFLDKNVLSLKKSAVIREPQERPGSHRAVLDCARDDRHHVLVHPANRRS